MTSLSHDNSGSPLAGDCARLWAQELGEHWTRWLPLGTLLLFALGASAPLADMDLPMHLATGAWIVRHHGVPFVEPFSWTRSGAEYYSYSWLPQVIYYLLYATFGPSALRVFHGLTFAAGGASLLWLARVAGWRPWTALYLIFLSLLPVVLIAAYLRPQARITSGNSSAWGAGLRILDSSRPAPWVAALALIASAAANSHLLFPVTALPGAIALTRSPTPWKRGTLIAAALLGGWAFSPYGLHWPSVFELYFRHNALLDFPPRIQEIIPGFLFARVSPICMILVVLLSAIPWLQRDSDTTVRERIVFGFLWFAGMFGFGLAGRALMVWWFAALPALVRLVERAPHPPAGSQRRMAVSVMASLPLVMSVGLAWHAGVPDAGLSSPARRRVDPLATWLEVHARPTGRPKVLTAFNYGSYLTWRLPNYSMSIDGRSIFPDSAARPDAYRVADDGPLPFGPWQSADLAIVPLSYPVAAVLDSAADWKRVDTVPADSTERLGTGTGLWVRRSWIDRFRR